MCESEKLIGGSWRLAAIVVVACGLAGGCNGPEPVDVVVAFVKGEESDSAQGTNVDVVVVTKSESARLIEMGERGYWDERKAAPLQLDQRSRRFSGSTLDQGTAILRADDTQFWTAAEREWDLSDEPMYIGVLADLPTRFPPEKQQQWYGFTQCTHQALDADSQVVFEVRDHASKEKPGVSGPTILDRKKRNKQAAEQAAPSQTQPK